MQKITLRNRSETTLSVLVGATIYARLGTERSAELAAIHEPNRAAAWLESNLPDYTGIIENCKRIVEEDASLMQQSHFSGDRKSTCYDVSAIEEEQFSR